MSTKTVVRGVLAALSSIMVQGLTADEVVVGNLERGVVDVAPETVLTPTRVSEEPEALSLEKLGGGTLAVPFENVLQTTALKIGVREGALLLSDNGGTPVAITEPPEAMQKAALWLEADKNVEVQDGSVRTWYDSRETKNGDVWGAKYYCATAEKGWDSASYPVLATVGGQTMLNFNGKKSGSYMRFSDTTRTEIGDITDIRHVFVVLDITDSWGFPLGNVGGDAYFHPENNDGTLGAYLSDSSVYPLTLCGRCYLDGVCFDPVATTVKTGRQVLSWEGIKDVTAKVGALFGDRGMWTEQYKRCGGNCIGAVVVFTPQLTVAESTAVEAYLIGKWKGTVRPSGAGVWVASGATARVSAAAGLSFAADKSVSVAGSGLVRTDGSGSVRLRASCGQGVPAAVEIGEDSTLVSELGELPLKLSDGDVVTKAQQGFQRTSGASGAVTLEGGIVRPSDLPATVKSFAANVDELVGGAPDAESAVLANAEVVEATIPDPSFEADYAACYPNTETEQNGWTFKCGADGYFIFPKPMNPGGDSWAVGTPYPAPDGEKILVLKHTGECWCTVHVPTNGVYELTFWTCKHDTSFSPKSLGVFLERDNKVCKLGRCWPMCGFGPERQCYRTDWWEAGEFTLRFSDSVHADCVHDLDDYHLRLVPDAC
ncbi:MAG: hypothetical protein KBT68_00170 [bacterium]|nr:hypothetical protein [Candidatus Colisoma equi]